MNDDRITARLATVVERAGLSIRGEHHASSLRVEFTTSPPLHWTYAQCDAATKQVLDAPLATPNRYGCHPSGQTSGTIGDHFSTDHDRIHSYWRFRLETHPETLIIA